MINVRRKGYLPQSGHLRSRLRNSVATLLAALVLFAEFSVADDGLRVDSPSDIVFSISQLNRDATDMGLSDAGFAVLLSSSLNHAGLRARRAESADDDNILFLDVVVEDNIFYVSLDFMRPASLETADGELNLDHVSVWQNYSLGDHQDDAEKVRSTVSRIVERFVENYRDANDITMPSRVAVWP